jgi:hypothetical protein
MTVRSRGAADAEVADASTGNASISGIWETESPTAREVPRAKDWFRFSPRRLTLPPSAGADGPPAPALTLPWLGARERMLLAYRVPNVAILCALASLRVT